MNPTQSSLILLRDHTPISLAPTFTTANLRLGWSHAYTLATTAFVLSMLAGCSRDSNTLMLGGSNRTLSAADFSGESTATVASAVAQRSARRNGGDPAAASPDAFNVNATTANGGPNSIPDASVTIEGTRIPASKITGRFSATDGISDVRAEPGTPASMIAAASAPVPISPALLVDAKVGDINGKPIYASRFLAPMAARFRQEAVLKSKLEWQVFAKGEIERTLAGFIEDELLRAEALASLSPGQKQGLFAFVERVQRQVLNQNRGSREQASRRVFAEEGTTIEEFIASKRERELINFQLDSQVRNRVAVTWRDIQQAYERNFDQFNSPPTFQFRLIRVFKDAPEKIEVVRSALATGASFAEIAALEANVNRRDTGGLEPREIKGEIKDAQFFPSDALNTPAKTLVVEYISNQTLNQVVGPIDLGATQAWLTLDTVSQRSVPLYQAQLGIENVLRESRERLEKSRYINRLKSRANISNPDEAVKSLLTIATERYFDPIAANKPATPRSN